MLFSVIGKTNGFWLKKDLDVFFSLCHERSTRLGKNGVAEVKEHPFFANQNEWAWDTIRNGI